MLERFVIGARDRLIYRHRYASRFSRCIANERRRANISSINFPADDFGTIFSRYRFRIGPPMQFPAERANISPSEREIEKEKERKRDETKREEEKDSCLQIFIFRLSRKTEEFSTPLSFTVYIKPGTNIRSFPASL